nr:uncharacterized protein LOC127338585 [Lolium perenne]
MAAVDLNNPIDWDEVDDFDGEARELACDFFYQVDSDEDDSSDDEHPGNMMDVEVTRRGRGTLGLTGLRSSQRWSTGESSGAGAGHRLQFLGESSTAGASCGRDRDDDEAARGQDRATTKRTFYGKIGMFPFVTEKSVERRSGNRPRGTMETKPLNVTRLVSQDYLIQIVLPAIKEKWPLEDRWSPIFIQQDNTKTHVLPNDPEFLEAAATGGGTLASFVNLLTHQIPIS